jgi:glycosyltransferase involved in cell wall biosynthesis
MPAPEQRVAPSTEAAPAVHGSRVVVVIPCHDEEATIGRVVSRFREVVPGAEIVVVDNECRDDTVLAATAAGARVVRESRVGKGFALLAGFAAAREADFYVMVDGDDTYPVREVPNMLAAAAAGSDMVVGTRLASGHRDAFPAGHGLGNRLFIGLVRVLFGIRTRDLFSGYRVVTRRFLDTVPISATGFDVEAELSVLARLHGFRVAEHEVAYRPRHPDSQSKLRPLHDGYQILRGILLLFRDYRPIMFFGWLAALLTLAALATGWAPVSDYVQTGIVDHMPRAVLAAGLIILAALAMSLGVLLSSINRHSADAELNTLLRKRSR